jgi:hypothetical protein
MARFLVTTFLSAFLLFQVQPVIGKYILPWFGGSPATWTACLLFFQVLLLAGYAYAHLTITVLTPRWQAIVHLMLLALAVALLPITPSEAWKPEGPAWPVARILGLLAVSIGVPFLVLSATAPLLQGWFNLTRPGASPYRLYALSNLGSLLALLSYPFVVERTVALRAQTLGWSAGFVLFAVGCAWCAWRVLRVEGAVTSSRGTGTTAARQRGVASIGETLTWITLAALGSVMLLAITNHLCQEVAVAPFLWVLPLSLYLLSFILAFESDRWYRRGVWGSLFAAGAAATCWVLYPSTDVSLSLRIAVFSSTLFASCMICHGELARRRPAPGRLTGFYLAIAGGGALGGVLVSVVAPRVFPGFWELHTGLGAVAIALLWVIFDNGRASVSSAGVTRGRKIRTGLGWGVLLVALWALLLALIMDAKVELQAAVATSRNFYGVLRVDELGEPGAPDWRYDLRHGGTLHGSQFRNAELRSRATSYYGEDSGVWLALEGHLRQDREVRAERGLDVGVVGLGVGTLAALGRSGDTIRFYEIDPEVVRFAERYFTYLEDTSARTEIVVGDARLVLERELAAGTGRRFDLLAVDAFTGGVIPVHLLTREAFEIYWKHLKADGILAVHISNRYLDLHPVVAGLAAELGKPSLRIDTDAAAELGLRPSTWVPVTSDRAFIESAEVASRNEPLVGEPIVWTDDFSNLFEVLQ